MRRNRQRVRFLVTATATAVLLLPWAGAALGAEPAPGSSQGGSPGLSAPAGVKVSTELPSTIRVDNKTGRTGLTATVTNAGDKATGPIVLKVVGFDALKVTAVEGGQPIPKSAKPPGNGGFAVKIADLAPGKSTSYKVSATYDLRGKGKICLPVTLGTSDTLLWQQGPVPFGTTNPTPNAPDTPLLLGTDNVPAGAGAGGTLSPSPSALPVTGPSDSTVPLAAGGVLLLAAGGTGLWLSARRPARH
jgi:LPXTG-motif cell wall-anchored protein